LRTFETQAPLIAASPGRSIGLVLLPIVVLVLAGAAF
jgi:hypothetical protein